MTVEANYQTKWLSRMGIALAVLVIVAFTVTFLLVTRIRSDELRIDAQRDQLTSLLGQQETTMAQGVAQNTGLIGALESKDAAATLDRAALRALIVALQSQEAALAARAPVPGPRGAPGISIVGPRGPQGFTGPPGPSGKPAPTPTPKPRN